MKDILPTRGYQLQVISLLSSQSRGSIDSAGRISGDAMKTMNALLKLQEKNLLKYVMFILLTTLLNHDYAIRHVRGVWRRVCSIQEEGM